MTAAHLKQTEWNFPEAGLPFYVTQTFNPDGHCIDGSVVAFTTINDHFLGQTMLSYRHIQKNFGSNFIAIEVKIIINDVSKLIDRSIGVKPFSFYFDVGSIHTQRSRDRLLLYVLKQVQFW
ncbi:hypothetical protein [Vibrio mediterranei]|uniref:hypothetical protein n=1 Tax=Vibrio mediterranei TaxID=689 RepID=UPI001EFDB8BA|nr:hypothetical protein [Vibrio mediterranei]MCG9660867.1 hypothetical protein [Vibrio mediterranei]